MLFRSKEHSDALRVLRWANNNPEVGKLLETWWGEELEELVKRVKKELPEKKEDIDLEQGRLKRLEDELQGLKDGQRRKYNKRLIIEFSIENIQVVNRRKDLQSQRKNVRNGFFI